VLQYLDSQFADVFVVVIVVAPRRPKAAAADDATPSFGGGGGDDDGGGGEHLADLGTTTRRRRATTTHERRNDAIFVDAIVFISLFVSNYSFVPRNSRKYDSSCESCHFLARSPPVTALAR